MLEPVQFTKCNPIIALNKKGTCICVFSISKPNLSQPHGLDPDDNVYK